MGKYVNTDSKGNQLPASGKVQALVADGAEVTDASFKPNLVCVVNNGFFEAAGYAFCEEEFEAFNQPSDTRPKTWLVYEHAAELAS